METTATTNRNGADTMTTSDQITTTIKNLTPKQRTILLLLCDAGEAGELGTSDTAVRLRVTQGTAGYQEPAIRETTTGTALVRRGLATRLPDGRFSATLDGYWCGDGLRILRRQGKIRPRD